MAEEVKKARQTKVKFLKGNQMGVPVGTTMSVNTAYAEKCEEKGWTEIVTTK